MVDGLVMKTKANIYLVCLAITISSHSQANDNHELNSVNNNSSLKRIAEYQSDNFSSRVRFIVIHFTSLDWKDSLRVLTEEEFAVSSHYLIPESGDPTYLQQDLNIYQLVNEEDRAWHAGKSNWEERTNINDQSIGIELVNQAECNFNTDGKMRLLYRDNYSCTYPDFDPEQIKLLISLLKEIIDKHDEIKPTYIVGHSDVAPDRKFDPGPKFPWKLLYDNGIGAWYEDATRDKYLKKFRAGKLPPMPQIQCGLKQYGYKIDLSSNDEQSFYVIRAFQHHFRPSDIDGEPDIQTAAILWALLEKYFPKSLDSDLRVICPNN